MNGGPPAEIEWFPCAPGAKPLPFASRICSLDWQDFAVSQTGIGEIFGAPRRFLLKRAIPGAVTDHFCGAQSDFEGEALPTPPGRPTQYQENGLPVCCPTPLVGGLAATGGAVPFLTTCCFQRNLKINGELGSYPVYGGMKVSNSVLILGRVNVTDIQVCLWSNLDWPVTDPDFPVSIGTSPFATDVFTGVVPTGAVYQFTNTGGFQIQLVTFTLSITLDPGTYWLTLDFGAIGTGWHLFWDQVDGPAAAYQNSTSDPIQSEYYCIDGTLNNTSSVEFRGPGTFRWRWPSGVTTANVTLWADGGGGGVDYLGLVGQGGGGGAGQYVAGPVAKGTAASLTFTIGGGGNSLSASSAGPIGNGTGYNGTGIFVQSGAVTIMQSGGGSGGGGVTQESVGGSGGSGGTGGFGGTTAEAGGAGFQGSAIAGGNGGYGGDCPGGGIGGAGGTSAGGGINGSAPGGGGGGGGGALGGGNQGFGSGHGAPGRVKIVWHL